MTRQPIVTPPASSGAGPSLPRSRAIPLPLALLIIVAFTALAVVVSPYLYDVGNSGRYLVGVLQAIDPALFPRDEIAASLGSFESLFYTLLGGALRLGGAAPESLPAVMSALYIAYRALLLLLLYTLTRRLSDAPWLFLLVAVWATVMQSPPLGGSQLFAHTLRHTEVAILICLGALVALQNGRPLIFYLLTAVALFVHPLVGLQFAICLVPVTLWETLRAVKSLPQAHRVGLVGLVVAVAVYALFMSPPPFSAAAAAIFVAAKGAINHISFANTSLLRWLEAAALLALAGVVYLRWLRDNRHARRLLLAACTGATIALALSTLASLTRWVPLMQFQPLRAFLWVYFFAMVVILVAAVRAWRHDIPHSALLLLYVAATLYETPAVLLFAFAAITTTIITLSPERRFDALARTALGSLLVCSLLALMLEFAAAISTVGGRMPGSLHTLLDVDIIYFAPALLLFLLLPQVTRIKPSNAKDKPPLSRATNSPSLAPPHSSLLTLYSLLAFLGVLLTFGVALYGAHQTAVARAGTSRAGWAELTDYIRDNSAVDARFISTYDAEPFRTRALRTAAGHNHGAVAWVDPQTFAAQNDIATAVKAARVDGAWDLDTLFAIARDANANAVITHGPYQGTFGPIFQYDDFRLFEVPR